MHQRMTEPAKGLHQNPHTTYSALVLTDRSRLHQNPHTTYLALVLTDRSHQPI